MGGWRIARIGLVALGVTVLLALPAYLGLRPEFIERYPAFEEPYDTWSTSLHADVACRRCHVEPGFVSQVAFGARMFGEFYASLVLPARQPALFGVPANAACNQCHMDLRTVSPSGDLNIPHRAHVEMLGMECVECHDFSLHESRPESPSTPPMTGCLNCHDGEVAKDDCAACHTDKDPPDSHFESDWLAAHAQAAVDDGCTSCHEWTAHWCAECHAVRPESHGEGWRAEHRTVVAGSEPRNCEACHEGPFCVRCHGVVPSLNFDPTLRLVE